MRARLFPRTLAAVAMPAALGACAPAQVSFICEEGEPLCDLVAVMNDEREEATGIDLAGVYLYQGSGAPLMESLVASPEPFPPVVAGRDALFRIFVAPHEDFVPRDLTGRIYLYRDGEAFGAYQTDVPIAGPSTPDSLDSTFNLQVSGGVIQPGVTWTATVVELKGDEGGGETLGTPTWPGGTGQPLAVTEGADTVRVLLVPVRYDADGSGRVPDVSADTVEFYRQYFWAFYPTADVEMIVGDELPWSQDVSASGSGWDGLLSAVADARGDQGAEDDMYMYGVFNPAADMGSFCGGGCVTGLSSVAASATDAWSRASIGVGFGGETTSSTMVHEVGHAHGLYHAPCGNPSGIDKSFPYDDGGIGVDGYDMRVGALREVGAYWDLMSYCSPMWVSDYNFDKLHTRVKAVSDTYFGMGAAPQPWWAVWVMSDGRLRWGQDRDLALPPGGPTRTIELLDAAGHAVGKVEAAWSPFSDLPGGRLTFPAPGPDVRAVRLDGVLSPPRAPATPARPW